MLGCLGFIKNNIIWGNGATPADNVVDSSTPSYCCIEGWTGGGVGNIVTDPRFVDPENGDFRLMPDSFCIDSGALIADVTEDFEGNPRPILSTNGSRGDGSGYDIGAFEFNGVVEPNLSPNPPMAVSPVDGATDELPILTLTCSAYSDPDGDGHAATQWQVDDHSDFLSPEFDSNPDSANLLSIVVPRQKLRLATFYHWRVRHQDQAGGWSDWSEPRSFTTLSVEGLIVPEDYPTIQAAIDAATDGDTITVTPGDYEEDVRLHGKNVLVTSLDPMDSIIVEQTKIAGTVIFSGTETEECVLQGFTITADSEIAPGIYNRSRLRGCKPTIQFNRIVNNSGSIGDCYGVIRGNLIQFNGSGLVRCGGVIEDNQILGNVDPYGGGLSDCDGTIRRNLIADNFAFHAFGTFPHLELIGRGGAFYECDGLIENNVIVGNEAEEDGSGFYLCDGTIRNNTIVNNPTKMGNRFFIFVTRTSRTTSSTRVKTNRSPIRWWTLNPTCRSYASFKGLRERIQPAISTCHPCLSMNLDAIFISSPIPPASTMAEVPESPRITKETQEKWMGPRFKGNSVKTMSEPTNTRDRISKPETYPATVSSTHWICLFFRRTGWESPTPPPPRM
ncbi:MAG: hypothetical protein H6751_03495 [Candidatus Omnitrophica bacterium]|nr:hypothetical protein [Candidatus Omnitrophota bacterium]